MLLCLQHFQVTSEDAVFDEDGKCHKFKVYVPPKHDATTVHLMLESGTVTSSITMKRSQESSNLWLVAVRVKPERQYRYDVCTDGWMKSKESIKEPAYRNMHQCLIHRDVFQPKSTPAVSVEACKLYMAEVVQQIDNSEDLFNAVHEQCRGFLDFSYLGRHDASTLMSGVTASAECVTNQYAANFIFICMFQLALCNRSCLTPDRIKAEHAQRLLQFLRGATLERSFLHSRELSASDVMINLVKATCSLTKVKASWSYFVHMCYLILTASEVIEAKTKTQWSFDDNFALNVVPELCAVVGRHDSFEQLLFSVINDIQSFAVFCKALKICKDVPTTYCKLYAHEPFHKLKCFVHKEISNSSSVSDLGKLCAVLCEVDSDLLKHFVKEFQDKILYIVKKKELLREQRDCFVDLALRPHLFEEISVATKLLCSLNESNRECLFSLLLPEKYAKIFANSQDGMIIIIYEWLESSVKDLKKRKADSIADLYSCLWKITRMHFLQENKNAMMSIQEKIQQYLTESIKKCDHYSDLLTIESLTKDVHADAFSPIQHILEDAVIRIVAKPTMLKTEFLPAFIKIVLSGRLFTQQDQAVYLLQLVSQSKDKGIHNSFVDIMKETKFWEVIREDEDREKLFRRWIEVARDSHCKNKAKEATKGTVERFPIMHLYEYVSDSLSKITVLDSYPNIQQLLEDTAREEYAALDPVAVVDMLTTYSGIISKPAKALLKKHLENVQLHKQPSVEELNTTFKELFERNRAEEKKNFIKR